MLAQRINLKIRIKDKPVFAGGIVDSVFCLALMLVIYFGIDRQIPFATKDYLAVGYIFFALGVTFLAGLYLIYDSTERTK